MLRKEKREERGEERGNGGEACIKQQRRQVKVERRGGERGKRDGNRKRRNVTVQSVKLCGRCYMEEGGRQEER